MFSSYTNTNLLHVCKQPGRPPGGLSVGATGRAVSEELGSIFSSAKREGKSRPVLNVAEASSAPLSFS